MAHVPVMESLSAFRTKRKIYIHINNTNPLLDRTSPERRQAEAAGWEIAHDGMEFSL
jgi:pyrroloquinoline quinone biosynthesis protein B